MSNFQFALIMLLLVDSAARRAQIGKYPWPVAIVALTLWLGLNMAAAAAIAWVMR